MRDPHEVVEQGIAGAGIAGNQAPVAADPGDVGDAADIHHGNVAGQRRPRRQGAVVGRDEGGPLPAGGDVGGTKVMHDGKAGPPGKRRGVTDLHGQSPLRRVKHGLTMEPDQIDGACRPVGRQFRHRHVFSPFSCRSRSTASAMRVGHDPLRVGEDARPGAAILEPAGVGKGTAKHLALCRLVGAKTARAEAGDRLAIGDEHRGIDAIHGGAAHQADRRFVRHLRIPATARRCSAASNSAASNFGKKRQLSGEQRQRAALQRWRGVRRKPEMYKRALVLGAAAFLIATPFGLDPNRLSVHPIAAEAAVNVSFDVFFNDLQPHGSWVHTDDYPYVFVPANVGPDWVPYTHGHWIYTDRYGWYFESDEPFAAITYHYGRWAYQPRDRLVLGAGHALGASLGRLAARTRVT